MLRKETVTPGALELLKELMLDENLNDFFLVGGTALSLQIGHRISIDIDLFSVNPFDEPKMLEYLEASRGFRLNYQGKNTLKGQIGNVQVDLITHAYSLVKPLNVLEDIRLASLEDIAAMKLNAIAGNGTRLKDFIDIVSLSCYLSLKEMIAGYEVKYTNRNPFIILKSLDYTADVNKEEAIEFVNGTYSWKKTEDRLQQMIENPALLFTSSPYTISQDLKT